MSDSPSGKGDKRIDRQVTFNEFSNNWDLAFSKDKKNTKEKQDKKE